MLHSDAQPAPFFQWAIDVDLLQGAAGVDHGFELGCEITVHSSNCFLVYFALSPHRSKVAQGEHQLSREEASEGLICPTTRVVCRGLVEDLVQDLAKLSSMKTP